VDSIATVCGTRRKDDIIAPLSTNPVRLRAALAKIEVPGIITGASGYYRIRDIETAATGITMIRAVFRKFFTDVFLKFSWLFMARYAQIGFIWRRINEVIFSASLHRKSS